MPKNDKNQQLKSYSVFRGALSMSVGTLSSRVLGFLRDALLAAYFSKTVTDAFIAAFRLPNLFRRLFGEGALAVSFIPVYVEQVTLNQDSRALSSAFFSILALITSILSVLGVLYMDHLIPFILSGDAYEKIQGKLELTIVLARIMFAYLFLVTNFAFFSSIAQSHKYFLIPALGPTLFNAVFILFCFLPQNWFAVEGASLSYGVLAGGIVQAGLVFALLLKIGQTPKLTLKWRVPGVFRVLKNTLPGIVGMGIVQFMSIINLTYLSRLEEGAISYFFFADRILELPQSLIAISLGAALLPKLSELWANNKKTELLNTSSHHIELLLFLALPCAVGVFILAQPIIETLFARGQFNIQDATQTALIVKVYSFLLIAASLNKVLVPNLYAIKNTWLPASITACCLFLHILIAPSLMAEYGLLGLAYSMTLAALLNTIFVFVGVTYFVGLLNIKKIMNSVLKLVPGLLLMGAAVYFVNLNIFMFKNVGPLEIMRPTLLLISIFSGVVVYFIYNYFFKNPLLKQIIKTVRRG